MGGKYDAHSCQCAPQPSETSQVTTPFKQFCQGSIPKNILATLSPSASPASSDLLSTLYLSVPHTAFSPHLPPSPFTRPTSFRPFPLGLGLKSIDIRAYYLTYDVVCLYYMYTIDIYICIIIHTYIYTIHYTNRYSHTIA